jgi:hypothetical protein
MKRLISIFTLLLLAVSATAIERPISFDKLPRKAQVLINTHFQQLAISYITKEYDDGQVDYEVHFANGSHIDFGRKGGWRQIQTRGENTVPLALLPESIGNYLAANHPDAKVIKVDKERREYEVKLTGGIELSFDHNGRFRWYED